MARAFQQRITGWSFGCVFVAAFLLAGWQTRAATFVWDGGHPAQNGWTSQQNWNPNDAPPNDGTADLVFTGSIRLAPDANGAWSVNSITFDTAAGAFGIVGDTITLQSASVALANNSASNVSFSNALIVGATQSWSASTGNLTLSGPIALGANTLTFTGNAHTTASGVISGLGSLAKSGTGTLTLSGANSYAGGTTVSEGTLAGTTTSLQGNIAIASAGTLTFDQGTSGAYAGALSGSGTLVKQNTGTVTLTGTTTHSGAVAISGGTLALGGANSLGDSAAVSVSSGALLQLAAASETIGSLAGAGNVALNSFALATGGTGASTTFSGALSGTGGLVKDGSGTFILSGANSYTGGTTINGGVLQGNATSLQGDIVNSASLVFDQGTNGAYGGVISGSGTLTKQNVGTLTLAGANTYTGATNIDAGTLALGAGNALSGATAVTIASGASLDVSTASAVVGSIAGGGSITLGGFSLSAGANDADTAFSGVISGTGGFTKQGTGTLTLSGGNSYTGGTVVQAGVLQGSSDSLQGNFTNNATVIFDQAASGAYAGNMSGAGALIKTNSGVLTLTGVNSYTGTTTVSGGTLQGTTASVQGDITNHAAVVFDQASNGAYAGVMSGTGSLTKQNTGTLTLSGANTYSGGTTVSGGTLQGDSTSLQGGIVNNAAVVFDQAANGTYAGTMSGAGSLTKQNTGTLILAGANSYSGGTTVSGGTLQGSTASLQGNIALTSSGAAVVFDQSTAGAYAGVLSGSGSLTKQSTGVLTLSGANTYTGGTSVTGGTLQGTTTSLQGDISLSNSSTLAFNQAANGTYAGVISGTGALTKDGAGAVTLSGANTFTGDTTVAAGTLALGATNAFSANSTLTLATGATVALNGFSTQVGTLAYNTAIVDFGAAGSSNQFLFTGGGTSSGTLTITNYQAGEGDVLAFQTGASGVTSTFIDGVYFYGIGGGTTGAPTTLAGYSGSWTPIMPGASTFEVWSGAASGSNDKWTSDANWSDGSKPLSGTSLKIAFDGTTRPTPSIDAAYTLNTLRFNATAGSFTLTATSGSGLTFAGVVPSMIQLSASAQTINAPVTLNTTTIIETSGAGALTISGNITGAGGINKVGSETLILSGDNSYTGATTIGAGTAIVRHANGLGSTAAGTAVAGGATLQLENNAAIGAESLALDGTLRNASGANSFAGAISGSGQLAVDGGSLVLAGAGANTFSGGTTINSSGALDLNKTAGVDALAGNVTIGSGSGAATLRLLASNQISDTSTVTLSAGGAPVFNLNGQTETIGSLASANAAAQLQLGAGGALTTGGDATSTTFAGVISGAGSLTKAGAGTFTLSGANTHSGTTTVTAGTLVLQNSAGLGSTAGGTSVGGGATLQLENNIAVGAESLALSGTLVNASGANSYAGAISGAGAVMVNAGTLTLAGADSNTYTGNTTVNAGTLELNKSSSATAVAGNLLIGSGAGAATVTLLASNQISDTAGVTLNAAGSPGFNLNGQTDTIGSLASSNPGATVQLGSGGHLLTGANNGSTTFAGAISGAGSLTKQGAGTFTLSGANTYSGGTTVSGGTLQGNTTSLQGNIANHASVVFDQAASGTYAGAMSGTGTLTKLNTGTLTLTGTNSYSGGTTVSAGTLLGNSSSLQGNIVNHGAVVFDQSSNGAYAGAMSGAGSLTKQNSGILTLTGANSYTGGTTVSAGTLAGSTTSLQGNITNQASVIFDQAATGTYAGVMSGAGSLAKQGSGTLILTGANSYTGGTTVSGGTLQGSTTSLTGNITNNAAVVFDQAATGTYSGVISGAGSVTKQNSGTLTLSGANTYSGATTVSAGTLALGASNVISNTSNLTLGAGSTFSLGGFSEQVNVLSFENATVNFGSGATANYFLFGSVDAASVGTLTVANWASGTDVFGVATNSISQSFLDNVYFSGINVGIGAVLSSTAVAVPGYGNFYALTPIPTFIWDGGETNGPSTDQDNWSRGDNWAGNIAPAVGAAKALVMAGSLRTQNDMNGAYQINSLLFRSDAGAFEISSSTVDTLTIGGGGINNQSANAQTLRVSISLAANQTWTAANGDLQILNPLVGAPTTVLNGARTLTIAGDFNTTIGVTIGNGSGGIVKNGQGTLTLSGTNTFTGGVTLNAGTVSIGSDGNLGAASGGLTFNGGTLQTTAGLTSARTLSLLAGGGTFNSNGFDSTLSGVISGAGGLTKTGAGTLTLSGANTYSGGTTISGGTLLGNTTSLQGNLTNNAALIFDQASAGTFAGVISGTGSVTKQNSGTLTLSGANTYSGGTTISAGTLQGDTTSLQGNITNNAALVFDQATAGAYGGVLSGTGNLTKQNSGALTLSGANTFTGNTTVSAGTLILQNSSALGTTANGTTVASGATLQLENNASIGAEALALSGTLRNAAGVNSYAGAISGSGNILIEGGTLTLSGTNTFTGGIALNAGTLSIGAEANLGHTSSAVTFNGGTLRTSASLTSARALSLLGGGGTFDTNGFDSTLSGVVSGPGGFTKAGAGILTLSGANTYSGGTTISGGTLLGDTTSLQGNITNNAALVFDQATNNTFAGVLSGTGTVTKQNSGTLTLSGANTYSGGTTVTAGTLQGDTTSLQGAIANNATVVFDQAAAGTYAGVMSGSGGLTKQNSGALALSGANTYAGATNVNGGTLVVQNSAALGTTASGTTVASGATLQLENNAAVGAESLALSGTLRNASGANSYAGIISGAGNVTVDGGVLALSAANTFTGGITVNSGTLSVGSDGNLGHSSGSVTLNGGTLQTSTALASPRAVSLSAGGGTFDTNSFNSTFSGAISGAGALTKTGAGTLTLSGANTYAGGTTVSAGTLEGNSTSLQGTIVNQAALVFNQAANGTFAGTISGAGTFTKTGAGTLTLTGASTFTGATLVGAGTLTLGASNVLPANTALTISAGATLDLGGVTQTIGSLAGGGTLALGTGTIHVGGDNSNTGFSGMLTGTGVFEKTGSGVLTFNSSFSFGGELKLTGGGITLAGIDLTVGTLRISGDTVLDFGNSVASTLSATTIIIENSSTLTITNWVHLQDYFYATGAFYGLNTNTLVITPVTPGVRGSSPQNQILFPGVGGSWTHWQSFDREITPAPEPATYGLFLIGASLGFIGYRRWRSTRK